MSAAQNLTRALRGSWLGHYGIARCPAHDDQSPSLSIATGAGGQLLLKCHAGCSYAAVTTALSPDHRPSGDQCSRADHDVARQAAIARAERTSRQAQEIWEAAVDIKGTPAERYLRHRGIICGLPLMLRYAPECWHLSAKRLPALLCKVTVPKGAAIHRTYLAPGG